MPEGRDPATSSPKSIPPVEVAELKVGSDLGLYRLVAELGTGGMGMLFVGEHRKIGRRMAIKVLNRDLARRADIIRRFFDEARSVNTINHEHIIEIFDFVSEPGGYNYLVMELLEGGDLQQKRVQEGPFELRRTLSIMAQVASGLGAAHKQQIIHRDVKPENVFLTQRAGQRDFVKLLDFGLAKLSESMKGNQDRTRAGTVLGTPEYMSPEQARGTTVDARSDVYSLGLLIHWMLLDRLPWATRDLAELLDLREKEPLALPTVTSGHEHLPRAVSAIVERCLQPSPTKRFQTCDELEQALRGVDPEDGKPAEVFTDSTVPMAQLAVIGAAPVKARENSTAPGKTPPGQAPKGAVPQALQAVKKTPPRPRPRAIVIPEEPRRIEIPWLALALVGSLSLLAYALYRNRPADRPALPEAPGSPYGASMMGNPVGNAKPAEPPVAPLVPTKP